MSRAINLKLPEANVRKRCDESGVSISAIEPLTSPATVSTTTKPRLSSTARAKPPPRTAA